MRSWFVLLLFGYQLIYVISRPQQADYNNDSDVEESEEEDDNESAAESYSADDDDSRLSDQDANLQEEVPRSRHLLDLAESRFLHRSPPDDHMAHVKADNAYEPKSVRNRDIRDENSGGVTNFIEQLRNFPKRRQPNRFNEEEVQRLNSRDNKPSRIQSSDNLANKRAADFESSANEEGDMIFEKSRDQAGYINKNQYNANEALDLEQPRYIKQFYNTMQAENREMADDKSRDGTRYNLRDRRDTSDENQQDNADMSKSEENRETNDKVENEDDASAIKRHIRKLSSEEFDQLLNSLTEEKRELLKKIIDESETPNDNAFINKREITKKSGAVEENMFIENCQSDLSKVQGGSASLDTNTESPSSASNSEATEANKQQEGSLTDNSDGIAKSSEPSLASVSKLDISSLNEDAIQQRTDSSLISFDADSKNQADLVANVQVTSKTDNKREVNLEDFEEESDSQEDNKISDQDYSNDQGYFCSQDENLSNIDDEGSGREEKTHKREAYFEKEPELSDSIRSLEESFPNSNAYDDSEPYSGPLVRVKRKNDDQTVKKRSAGFLPEAKVAYFPYKAENEDEDNYEGNEFDEEGFYDGTANLANKGLDEDAADRSQNSAMIDNLNPSNSKSTNENMDSDTMSLGSDSDSVVLSGVEGAEDNLMYSGGVRSRRTAEDNSSLVLQTKIDRPAPGNAESKSISDNYVSAQGYQENDAFGPLPRNYDGDLNRYKRIRRVKQLHTGLEPNSSDNT